MLLEEPGPGQGFSLLNLAILIVIVAVLWPLLHAFRQAATKHRRRQYESEEPDPGFTEESDPDLRHDGR